MNHDLPSHSHKPYDTLPMQLMTSRHARNSFHQKQKSFLHPIAKYCVLAITLFGIQPTVNASTESSVGFSAMEVIKLNRDTRDLLHHDIDGDGRKDLLLINNGKASIQLLRQYGPDEIRTKNKKNAHKDRWDPILEDNRFEKLSVITGLRMYSIASADLDGNGLPDIVVTAKNEGVVIYYQKKQGRWERGWSYNRETPTQWNNALIAEDIDNDGLADLAMLGEENLLVFLQRKDGHFHPVRRYPLADPDNYGLMSADINQDGNKDLLYITHNSKYSLRVRLQDITGGFAVERLIRLDTPRNVPVIKEHKGKVKIAYINAATGLIEISGFKFSSNSATDGPLPWVYALPHKTSSASAYAVGDLDGNAMEEIIVSDPDAAKVWIYKNLGSAIFAEPHSFPVFSGVTSISVGDSDADSRMELYLASREEQVISVAEMNKSGRLSFPRPIIFEKNPLVLTFLPAHTNKPAQLAIVFKHNKKRVLKLFQKKDDNWIETQAIPLKGLSVNPSGIKALDWNQDGNLDLALFAPRSPTLLFYGNIKGDFDRYSADQGFRSTLFDGLRAGDFHLADIDSDSHLEIVINGKGFVRTLAAGSNAVVSVKDQYNLNDPATRASSALLHDYDSNGSKELLITMHDEDKIEIQQIDKAGLYRPWRSFNIGKINLLDTQHLATGTKNGALLYLGKDRFWVIKNTADNISLDTLIRHETDLKDVNYGNLAYGNFSGDDTLELVALDDRKTRILEILQEEDMELIRKMHFTVFENPGSSDKQNGKHEPREILATDINGDNKDDAVLLVHDRLLIYMAQ